MTDLIRRIGLARTWLKLVTAGLLGAMTGLGQAPWGLWPLTLVGLCIAAMMLDATPRPRRAALFGWAFGTGYFALVLFWITEPFYVDAARHAWMAPFALALMAGGMALFWGAAFGAARWLGHAPASLIVTFTATELLRAYIFTGFPWGMVAYIWVDTPLISLSAWIGPHGLNALTLALTVGVYHLSALKWRGAVAGIGLWAAVIAGALWPSTQTAGADGPTLRLIQPNAPQHLKWDPDWVHIWFDRQLEYTSAPGHPDLIIWPETAVPSLLGRDTRVLDTISEAAGPTPVIFGMHRRSDAGFHNSMIVLDGDGNVSDVYDKFHLVPFGEYVPGGEFAAKFGLDMFDAQSYGYAAGAGPVVLELAGLGTFQPLICYEAVFPQDVNGAGERPDWMLQITNDAWFGSYSGPYQHLVQAQFRAVEQGLPLVRVANTGVSAVINRFGAIMAQIPLNTEGYLDTSLPPPGPPTLYSRTGDWPAIMLMGVLLASLIATRRRNSP